MSLKLPASMRTKRRYLRIRGGGREVIERRLLQGLGTLGWARAAPLFVRVTEMPDIVLSVDRRCLDEVRAALELAPEPLRVTRVSGTLKGLQHAAERKLYYAACAGRVMHRKEGQMQLSFGMIFSILIIIVTIAVAFYVIKEFFLTSRCAEVDAFHNDLQREIDTVWRSAAAQLTYKQSLPSSVKSLCFGNPATWDVKTGRAEAAAFASYRDTDKNFFVYPIQCGRATSVRQLSHVSFQKGFCVPAVKGEVRLTLSKASSTSGEVTLAP